MGKWAKYLRHFKASWLQENQFKPWLKPASEEDVKKGKQEAYCTFCDCFLRAHHSDLVAHCTKTARHIQRAKDYDRSNQKTIDAHVLSISDTSKIADLKLAVFIASHCSLKTIDHLGDILKMLGKGSVLENTKLHRTKCSKLISAVIAPTFLTELVRDIGYSPYSLIVDEATDVSVSKFLGICVRYHSKKRKQFLTDFLGMVQVRDCTGKGLSDATKKYLEVVGLPLKQLEAIGCDGASVMVGQHNSYYTHMREDVPTLRLFKCVCHSLDKCAEHAYKKVPDEPNFILTNAYNRFAHSAKGWDDYSAYYKAMNNGKQPKRLQSLSKTRWSIWVPVSDLILDQWTELRGFFALQRGDHMAAELARLMSDKCNQLYLLMMKSVLSRVEKVNFMFQHSEVDVTKLYSELRGLVYATTARILKNEALPQTARPGVLRVDELDQLRLALQNPANQLPLDRAEFGASFKSLIAVSDIPEDKKNSLRQTCGQFIFSLCNQVLDRLPTNLVSVEKMKFFQPKLALARAARPHFDQLPLDLADPSVDKDVLESQWLELGTTSTLDLCPGHNGSVDDMDVNHFWTSVFECRNACGDQPFKELALFALKVLTVPVSNAVVERLFSVMSCIKTKLRNRLQLLMLEALLRVRVHLKVDGLCCRSFAPSKEMLGKFNSSMYVQFHDKELVREEVPTDEEAEDVPDEDYDTIITIFDERGELCVINI